MPGQQGFDHAGLALKRIGLHFPLALQRPERLGHRQHLERQVRHFTKCRVRLDSNFCVATFDKGNPDQKRRDKKANFMAKLQAELLHYENWDGTPRT